MPRWRNLKIGPRIFLGFSLIAFLTLLVAGVSIAYLRGVAQNLHTVAEQDRILQTSALELRLAVEQESGNTRGYLLSGDQGFLDALAAASSRYLATTTKLQQLALSDEEMQLLKEVDALHSRLLSIGQEQFTLHDQGFPAAAVYLWQTEGYEVSSSLDSKLADLISRRENAISEHTDQARQRQNQALVIALSLVGVSWIAGIGGWVLTSRSITKPIYGLVSATEAMGKGELSVRVPIQSGDELGLLGDALNKMAKDLDESQKTTQHLYLQERRRADQMRAINEMGQQISSLLSLDQLLPYVVNLIQRTFSYYNVNVLLLDSESEYLVLKASAGGYEGEPPLGEKIKIGEQGIVSWVAQKGEPLLARDVAVEPRYLYVEALRKTRAELAVPIKIKDTVVGVLDIESAESNTLDEADVFIAQTLANQLAVAIDNARLYEQAQELATVHERQRLARDLHDAVTQTLFSASLIADVLPRLWQKDAAEGQRRLEEIRLLTRGALAEMRMLLLELRPAALTEVGLVELLRQLTEATTGRARLPISLALEGQCDVPADMQIAFYRVAQEAVNNIIKHSSATKATVNLTCQAGTAKLTISDNGVGFNPENISPDHLGLRIMHERAEAIGASLKIESQPGHGTQVAVVWPDSQRKESL